tara:strand:+ start:1528 stop:1680 length:153 start_codon:yes stop_codon:yes gene_type:complete
MNEKFDKKKYIEDLKYRQGRSKRRVELTEKWASKTIIALIVVFVLVWMFS